MAIIASEIKWKKSAIQSDDVPTTNGGGMISDPIPSNYFPDVTGSQRTDGITRYRKGFVKQENDDANGHVQLTLNNAKLYLRNISAAGDFFRLALETAVDDVQDPTAEAITSWSGVAVLTADIHTADESISVQGEDHSGFADSAEIIIFNSSDPTQFEVVQISTVGTWSNNVVTLNLAAPLVYDWDKNWISFTGATTITGTTIGKTGIDLGVANARAGQLARISSGPGAGQTRRIVSNTTEVMVVNYAWDPLDMPTDASTVEIIETVVAQLVPAGNIVASSSNWDDSYTTSGTYNEGTYPVELFPIGTITDNFSIEFVAGAGEPWRVNVYRDGDPNPLITGANVNPSGGSPLKPVNGSSYYFELNNAGFGGTWAVGDAIYFSTAHSAKGFWVKHTVPPGTDPHAGNRWDVGVIGDTV